MVMILSGLLKHVRGGLDLKRFDHILITVGGGTGTKKIGPHTRSVKNHLHLKMVFQRTGLGPDFFFFCSGPPSPYNEDMSKTFEI